MQKAVFKKNSRNSKNKKRRSLYIGYCQFSGAGIIVVEVAAAIVAVGAAAVAGGAAVHCHAWHPSAALQAAPHACQGLPGCGSPAEWLVR
jgi:hypothetical protein